MFAVPVRTLAAVAVLTAACAAHAADPLFDLTVNPSQVAAGGTLTLTGSVTNVNKKASSFVVNYAVTGPCNYTDESTYAFKLAGSKTRTASETYVAPECTGTYTVYVTVSSGGSTVARTASFVVY